MSMNLKEVHRALQDMFQKELTNGRKRHIVFWYDEEGEFAEDINEIHLDNVRIWEVTENNLFATKYELEKEDTSSHFLLYANMPKPIPRDDWLYDLYKLGYEFATDKITAIMRELGAGDDGLRETFQVYKSFFNNKARFGSFRKFPVDYYTEETVDLTVLAVLVKSKTNTIDDILRTLLRKQKDGDNTAWENIQKYGSEEKFWLLMEKYYGYVQVEKSLRSLLTFLIITYLGQQSGSIDLPKEWQDYVSNRPTNVVVFMDQWMNHRDEREVYNHLAIHLAEAIQAEQYVASWDLKDMIRMDAFPIFDENIIHYLVEQLTDDLAHFNQYLEIISIRRRLHWYPEYEHEYEAIYQAIQLIRKLHEMDYFIPEQAADQMFKSYVYDYYAIDMAYRNFYIAYDQIEASDRLHMLCEKVENLYTHRFVEELSLKWVESLESKNDAAWPIVGINQQMDFYRDYIAEHRSNDERVFVIISDSLRFEVANELMHVLNNERKATTDIAAMQGVLPSYTALGMASLLPHKQIEYTEDGKVLVDGIHSSGIMNRQQILEQNFSDALAVHYDDIAGLNRAAFREKIHGKKIIYIYHDAIDAKGDNAATEKEVFKAAGEAISDIRMLVNRLVVDTSASNILITADHGFIYQRKPIEESQKLPNDQENTIIAKRRFTVSDKPDEIEGTLTYDMDYILEQEKQLSVTVPKGVNRFKVQGAGANYVHGGAMLQEMVIPVITFKNDRSKSLANAATKTDVKLTTPMRKITNTTIYLEFFQTSRIEDKKRPRNLTVYFADEDGKAISNENRIIADHDSSLAAERTFREKFVFKSTTYDRRKTYYLILKDEEEKADHIYEQYAFTIDIAFME